MEKQTRIDESFLAVWNSESYPELTEEIVKGSHLPITVTFYFDAKIKEEGRCFQEVYEKVYTGKHTFQGVGVGLAEDYIPTLRGVVEVVRD